MFDWRWFTLSALLWTGAIFTLRMVNIRLDTLRVLAVVRGKKLAAWMFSFFEVILFLFIFNWVCGCFLRRAARREDI